MKVEDRKAILNELDRLLIPGQLYVALSDLEKAFAEVIRDCPLSFPNTNGAIAKRRESKLCEALHDLLGPFDGRDPETDGPIDLETNGARIRKAQAVLEEVE